MNWDSEQECFESFSRQFSSFYAVQYDPYLVDSNRSDDEDLSSLGDEQVWPVMVNDCQLKYSVNVEITSETSSMALDY